MPASTDVKIKALSYVIIYVPDTKNATKFYQEKLGFSVKMEEDGWVELESGPTTIALHAAAEPDMQQPTAKTMAPILVFKVDNIQDAYAALKGKGVEFNSEPHEVCSTPDHVGYSADFSDPFGNKLSIYGETKK